MSSRVAGAALALIAAALLAVSVATPAVLPSGLSMFAGHPTVDGRERKSQNMYIGLYRAELCNNGDVAGEDRGGETVCKAGESQGAFHYIGFVELGATGIAMLALIALGGMTLSRSEGRKGAARVARIAAAVGLAGAVGLVATHPVGASAAIPIGLGMLLQVGGLVGGLIASVIAVRPPAPIKLRSKPTAPPQPGIDVDALFQDRPSQVQRPSQPQFHGGPAPFGINPGTHPGAHPGARPQQQLRPLYEATPMHGGTGGLMPFAPPQLPARAPTPVPRAMFEVDIDVEPSMIAPMPQAQAQVMPPSVPQPAPPPMQAMHDMAPPAPLERTKPKTLPPPMPGPRSKPMTARPPLPFLPPTPMVPDEPAMTGAIVEPSEVSAPPIESDGRPEAQPLSPNTEPTAQPDELAPPEPPPPPRPSASTSASASGSVPAIPAAPPPRPARDTRAPAMRASVPLPARPPATRPPPIRTGLPKATIAAPVVPPPIIPPIPGIPTVPTMPAMPPPVTAQQRAETQLVPELAAARVPVEITDNASQTNVSSIPDSTAQVELEEAAALADEPSDTAEAEAVRPSDTSPSGQPAAIPPGNPTAVAFPVPIALAAPSPVRAPKLPLSTAPDSLPPPKDNKAQASGPSPACPQCEAPMAWVEEHLRFYCKSCRMYF